MQIPRLELLYRLAAQSDAVPVLFVHGIFSGAWIWEEYFLDWFAAQGYQAYALSFRGHGRSSAPNSQGQYHLTEYVQDLEDAIQTIRQTHGQEPLLAGHSMGGMVVQRYLSNRRGRGAVLLTSIPPQGLVPLSWASLFTHPLESMMLSRSYLFPEQTTPEDFYRAMFSGPVELTRIQRWMQQMVPESLPLIWDISWLDLPNVFNVQQTPIEVLGALHDRVIPSSMITLTAATYGCTPGWIDAGHGVMLDATWQKAAVAVDAALQNLLQRQPADQSHHKPQSASA